MISVSYEVYLINLSLAGGEDRLSFAGRDIGRQEQVLEKS